MALIDGKQLAKLRSEYGITQVELAEYLGYMTKGKPNRSMIARFENGHAEINPRISKLLENYFMNHNISETYDEGVK